MVAKFHASWLNCRRDEPFRGCFLVDIFKENARLTVLVFFHQLNAIGSLFCSFVQLLRQLIFRLSEAGQQRGFESRIKSQVS